MPYLTRLKKGGKFLIPQLAVDGQNWSDYRTKLFEAAETQGLLGLLDGTNTKPNEPWNLWCIAAWLRNDTEAQYLLTITTHLPFGTTSPSQPLTTCSSTYRIYLIRILHLRLQYTTYGASTAHEWLRTPPEHPTTVHACSAQPMRRCATRMRSEKGREDNERAHRVMGRVASANARRRTMGELRQGPDWARRA